MRAIVPPRASFPVEPEITSDQELNEALHEIGMLKAHGERQTAVFKLKLAELSDELQRSLKVSVQNEKKREDLEIVDHVKALEAAIEDYAKENRDKLLEKGKKSREFTHGKIAWVSVREGIEYVKGCDSKSAIKKLESTTQILAKFLKLMASVFFVGKLPLSLICEPKITLSTKKALEAYQQKKLTKRDLRNFDMKVVGGGKAERFEVKPHKVVLDSEAA